VASKFAGFKFSWLKCVGNAARQGVQNMHDCCRRPQAPQLSGLSWIMTTPLLQLLCISSGVVVSQGASRPAAVFRALFAARCYASVTCRHAVSVCLSVCACLSRSWILSKRINISSIFLQSGSHTIPVFPRQTALQYSDGKPLTGASNAGRVSKNRDSEPISGFAA